MHQLLASAKSNFQINTKCPSHNSICLIGSARNGYVGSTPQVAAQVRCCTYWCLEQCICAWQSSSQAERAGYSDYMDIANQLENDCGGNEEGRKPLQGPPEFTWNTSLSTEIQQEQENPQCGGVVIAGRSGAISQTCLLPIQHLKSNNSPGTCMHYGTYQAAEELAHYGDCRQSTTYNGCSQTVSIARQPAAGRCTCVSCTSLRDLSAQHDVEHQTESTNCVQRSTDDTQMRCYSRTA
jgi:hypothetical protein